MRPARFLFIRASVCRPNPPLRLRQSVVKPIHPRRTGKTAGRRQASGSVSMGRLRSNFSVFDSGRRGRGRCGFHAPQRTSDKRAPGGSTLTQQTVKNLFLSHDRSYFRKAQEIILTPIVEAIWGKTRILEIYLNIAEFGNGIFGAQAASRYYFNKNAANLSRAEAIRLASILINPKKYQFVKSAPPINRRVNRISHDLNLVQIPQR